MKGAPRVRHARLADLTRVAELAAEHASYEEAAPPAPDLAERLGVLLFDTANPRLRCLVAELPDSEVVGYATCAPELSTWDGREYLHMDCLFLRSGNRGLGLTEVQWQTPAWNEGAVRFYDRIGAGVKEKLRYTLPVQG
ncbi:GNAT family N-acetyltransferase [Streptomyces sp. NPDC004647]|uniref:GNAT family N-acetyltransferase n=1 Tax=Streptomyces sp. NPDC004647 TaxID=3154671 RepID=UPI0033AEC652